MARAACCARHSNETHWLTAVGSRYCRYPMAAGADRRGALLGRRQPLQTDAAELVAR